MLPDESGHVRVRWEGENFSWTFKVDPDRIARMLDVLAPIYESHPLLRTRGFRINPDALTRIRTLVANANGHVDDAVPTITLQARQSAPEGLGPNDAAAPGLDRDEDDLADAVPLVEEDENALEDEVLFAGVVCRGCGG